MTVGNASSWQPYCGSQSHLTLRVRLLILLPVALTVDSHTVRHPTNSITFAPVILVDEIDLPGISTEKTLVSSWIALRTAGSTHVRNLHHHSSSAPLALEDTHRAMSEGFRALRTSKSAWVAGPLVLEPREGVMMICLADAVPGPLPWRISLAV